ncbi:MAG: hypothetical protein WAZ27_04705 [Minisyncoccia bacterium]
MKDPVLDIVGDTQVMSDLHHRHVVGKNGKERKRILFVLGGGKAGIVTAERLHVFHEAGIPADHFDLIVGISAGAYNSLAYGARQTAMLREMYLYFSGLPMVWDQVYELICEMEKKFDREMFERSKPEFLIGVSNHRGDLSLHQAKSAHNLFGLLYAGSAIPPFSSGRLPDGALAYDGAFAHPCPVRESVRKMRGVWEPGVEMDIVLLANRPRPENLPMSDIVLYWWGVNVFLRMWTPLLCPGANAIDSKVADAIPVFEKKRHNSRFRTCAWFPSEREYILPVEWSSSALTRVADAIGGETQRFLETVRPRAWV